MSLVAGYINYLSNRDIREKNVWIASCGRRQIMVDTAHAPYLTYGASQMQMSAAYSFSYAYYNWVHGAYDVCTHTNIQFKCTLTWFDSHCDVC